MAQSTLLTYGEMPIFLIGVLTCPDWTRWQLYKVSFMSQRSITLAVKTLFQILSQLNYFPVIKNKNSACKQATLLKVFWDKLLFDSLTCIPCFPLNIFMLSSTVKCGTKPLTLFLLYYQCTLQILIFLSWVIIYWFAKMFLILSLEINSLRHCNTIKKLGMFLLSFL